MLSQNREYQSLEVNEAVWNVGGHIPHADDRVGSFAPTRFSGQFADCMEMRAPVQKVAEYLDVHQEWFCRCAQPMKVEPINENGYALVIGRFGAFGYDVEPKVGLELLPAENNVYRIKTIAIPNYVAPGYDVDFKAVMELVEHGEVTKVEWKLDLNVDVQFPKFIHRLPKSVVKNTGDRLLNQIVRQVSRRLTVKVQADFYKSLGV
ncbi:DUF1997 domain-containing protein [Aliterella atlantica]|uniref:DUF1997 domain-containing protein n=1 Tax=Aliterella atlantica CENA595 TaxID=1618023 RepID=A0A0D8ZX35_9CYAN|nr:DUF1997 domain-containing protein [Aliterella atlantica]KJH73320.1 hypothetical protein UH38_00540 [Aliterella atlantica CENA595]